MARKPRRPESDDEKSAPSAPGRASARERALARQARRLERKRAKRSARSTRKAARAGAAEPTTATPARDPAAAASAVAGGRLVALRGGLDSARDPGSSDGARPDAPTEAPRRRTPREWIADRRTPAEWVRHRRELKRSRPPKPKLKKLRFLIVLGGMVLLACISWLFGVLMAVADNLGDLEGRAQYAAAENSIITDVTGTRLATLTNNEGRILVDSDEIASVMKEATVAIEDERFYEHRGIDFQGIMRAAVQDVISGSAEQGASTITQQFVKNALEAQHKRTVLQKLTEAAYAYHIEREWNKDKILTEYLNSIYFGEGAYGVEAAAQTYWGWKHPGCGDEGAPTCASELTPPEAALLAALIQAPSSYSNDEADAIARRNIVLQKMAEQGKISPDELDVYESEGLPDPAVIKPPSDDSVAPYFTSWLRQQLVDHYGAGEAFGGGLVVKSTLDLELQRAAEADVASNLSGLGPSGAVVVIDNATGGVRAMVGGSDYENTPFNLATNGRRQPGSSFKPFTLITALRNGASLDDAYSSQFKEFGFDIKTPEGKVIHDLFKVNNYDDAYLGTASLWSATENSDNSVFAEVGLKYGVDKVVGTAQAMGIETDLSDPNGNRFSIGGKPYEPYNPSIILGGLGTGVSPLEMAHAYETLAKEGNRVWGTMGPMEGPRSSPHPTGPIGIASVTDEDGEPVEDRWGASGVNEPILKQVIPADVADEAATAMTRVVTSGTGENAQVSGQTIWGKTGTTDDNGDAWFCGSTVEVTICVWVGYADKVTPMLTEFGGNPVDGGTIPAMIFHDVLTSYLEVMERREAGEDSSAALGDETTPSAVTPTYTPTTTTPVTPAETETPAEAAPIAPTGGGGGGGGGGGAPAPASSSGGIG